MNLLIYLFQIQASPIYDFTFNALMEILINVSALFS